MASMQEKVLAELTKIGEGQGYDVVQKARYANTGALYFQQGFDTAMVVDYQFNDDYWYGHVYGPWVGEVERLDVPAHFYSEAGQMSGASCPQEARTHPAYLLYVKYIDGDAIKQTFRNIETLLERIKVVMTP